MATTGYIDLPVEGGAAAGVSSLNSLTGALTLAAGSGITITPSGGNTLTIAATGGGTGTVTSVALAAPAFLTVSGSPVTTSGTLTLTLATQTANTVFSGPSTGAAAAPTFRVLVAADIPTLPYLSTTLGTANGLSVSTNTLSLGLSSTSTTGALSSTDWNTFNGKQTAGNYITALSGDVVAAGPGSAAATIQNNVVSNAKLAQMATLTIKGNNTGGTANALDLTVAQVNAILPVFTTTLNGLAPLSGGGSTNFLRADGTWAVPTGTSPLTTKGDVYTFSTVNTRLAVGTDGMVLSADSTQTTGLKWIAAGGTGTVTSVALSNTSDPLYTISGSPITTTGTINLGINNQSANTVFAGATSGGAAAPAFRALVVADIPALPYASSTLTNTHIFVGNGSNVATDVAASGDVTLANTGAFTIANNVVSNAKLAQMPTLTLKGNNTGGTANALDLTVAQVNTMLGTTGAATSIGALDAQAANANGLALISNVLSAQSADATHPGMVNNTTQTLSGNKTFSGQTAVSNTSTTALTVNTNALVVDATNKIVGIGIAPDSTVALLDIVNNSGGIRTLQITGYGSQAGHRGRYANGTSGSPTAATNGNIINFFSARGYGATGFATASTGVMNIVAGETFTDTSMATYISFATTPTTSITSAERVRINSTGNVLIGSTSDNGTDKLQVTGSATISSTLTMGAAFYPKVVTLTDAATVATNAALGNQFRVTLGGNRTLGTPTNPVDGQKAVWEFIQDGTGTRTITLSAAFALGTTVSSVTLSTGANKHDFMGAVYNSNTSLWYVLAFAAGY